MRKRRRRSERKSPCVSWAVSAAPLGDQSSCCCASSHRASLEFCWLICSSRPPRGSSPEFSRCSAVVRAAQSPLSFLPFLAFPSLLEETWTDQNCGNRCLSGSRLCCSIACFQYLEVCKAQPPQQEPRGSGHSPLEDRPHSHR